MAFLTRDEVFQRFEHLGCNSSHFIWLIAELRYYESKNGWVFAFLQKGKITLLALEPLIPGAPSAYSPDHFDQFQSSWQEFLNEVQPKTAAFVGTYQPFVSILQQTGFQSLKVGKEPWVSLECPIASGNESKGVRAAKNQAIKAGITVQEWSFEAIQSDLNKQNSLVDIYKQWGKSRWLTLGGFLNKVDPLAYMKCRRYFVAITPQEEPIAYLVVTPVPGVQGYFLEDLIYQRRTFRGIGELLTLEALEALKVSGGKLASLGVVSATCIDSDSMFGFTPRSQILLRTASQGMTLLYNLDGMEVFRKRFKPKVWKNIYLSVKDYSPSHRSQIRIWLEVLIALLLSFEPRFTISWDWTKDKLSSFGYKYPMTLAISVTSFVLFSSLNHFGELPGWALNRYGFSAAAPLSEWAMRSIVSDLLYFDPIHFWVWGVSYFFLLAHMEKIHRKTFIVPYILLMSVFDDFINYLFIMKPFFYFHPMLFEKLVVNKDVGGSLVMISLIGLQICQFRKNREVFFALASLGIVFGYIFTSYQFQFFILNINHFLFLSIGYIVGKLKFDFDRRRFQKASKRKTPIAYAHT